MGLTYADIRHLLDAREGVTGGKAVTLGRLSVYLHRSDVRALRTALKSNRDAQAWFDHYRWGEYADGFFRHVLRFETVDAIDISDYEGATIVHDLGEPIAPNLEAQFDLVVDGGTLEHVFNFPVGITNLMRMVKLGGLVYSVLPCNNLCGHGFYQFSPELMHRLFSAQRGYELMFVRVAKAKYLSVEMSTKQPVYDVRDPAEVGTRINLVSRTPLLIMTMARRESISDPRTTKVLQSDYTHKWNGEAKSRRLIERVKAKIRTDGPSFGVAPLAGLYMRRRALLTYKKHFRRVG